MNRQSIKVNYLQTISWLNDKVIDWACAGTTYALDGKIEQINQYHFGGHFDSAITSACGQYAFIYKRLNTKGLLLKNGEILREINRSYYHAETYEYPAAFLTTADGTAYLVHCPIEYCRLDFENVETGAIVTNTPERKPVDFFHSRLEISPDGQHLISKGWAWHPWDMVKLFNIPACLENPVLLDKGIDIPNCRTEISSASFIDNERILVYASGEEGFEDEEEVENVPPGHMAIWNFKDNTVSKAVLPQGPCGNFIAIDDTYCWDLFTYPKIFNMHTGEVVDKIEEISTGRQVSSIIHYLKEELPQIAYNKQLQQLAVYSKEQIEVLWR